MPDPLPAPRVSRVWVFGTMKEKSLVSRATCFLTDGFVSHIGIGFDLIAGPSEYYELQFDDPHNGPKSAQALLDWGQRPGCHLYRVFLPLTGERAEVAYDRAREFASETSYRGWQLVMMALFERYRIPFGGRDGSKVCSGYVVGVLGGMIDLTDRIHNAPQEVNPGSAMNRLMYVLAGYPEISASEAGTQKSP